MGHKSKYFFVYEEVHQDDGPFCWNETKGEIMGVKRLRKKTIKRYLKDIGWTYKDAKNTLIHCWNLNVSLALVLYCSARKMREEGMSYPPELEFEEWHKILGEIEEGMKTYLNEDEWVELWLDDREEYNKQLAKVDRALELVKEYFYTLWD